MRNRRLVIAALAVAVVVAGVVTPIAVALAAGPPNVTTAGYNNLRDNWDPNEPALGPTQVTSSTFTQLFSTNLDGSVYAQPLVVNGTVIVTTEKASAYGINATTGAIEWKRYFGTPFEASTIGCSDLTPDLGSTSTPVVDPATGIVYMTTRLEKGSGGLSNAHWYLEAVSAATGAEVSGYPVRITGTPTDTPGVPFNEAYSQQRPGLLLLGGSVYIAFASDCDFTPYRGVVVGVNTATRAETMWSDESGIGTDQNSQAGIWQSGGGLVSNAAEPDHPDHRQRGVPAACGVRPPAGHPLRVGAQVGGQQQRVAHPGPVLRPERRGQPRRQRRGLRLGRAHRPPHRRLRHDRPSRPAGGGRQGGPDLPARQQPSGWVRAGREQLQRGARAARAVHRGLGPPGRLRRPGGLGLRAGERRRGLPARVVLRAQRPGPAAS